MNRYILLLTILPIFILPVVSAENVLIIGRCRTIGSNGEWDGYLYIGFMTGTCVGLYNTDMEGIVFIVYGDLHSETPIIRYINVGAICMRNNSGIFFWGSKGFSTREIPPIIFIMCRCDEISINTGVPNGFEKEVSSN